MFKIKVTYAPKVAQAMKKFAVNFHNTNRLLQAIGKRTQYGIKKNIVTSKSPDGSPIRALLHPRGFGGPPLYATGTMFNSIEWEITEPNRRVVTGPRTSYARWHQEGFTHNRSGKWIAPRPFVGLNGEMRRDVDDSIRGWVDSLFGAGYYSEGVESELTY